MFSQVFVCPRGRRVGYSGHWIGDIVVYPSPDIVFGYWILVFDLGLGYWNAVLY